MDGHKVEGCKGRWIEVGTLTQPYLQKCSDCRGTRQRPIDDGEPDVPAMTARERRHLNGIERLRQDLQHDLEHDPVHQDEEGFWFWDMDRQVRYGPYETHEQAEQEFRMWLDAQIEEGDSRPDGFRWWLLLILLACAFGAGWVARGL